MPKKKKEHNLLQTLEVVELVLANDKGTSYDLILDNTDLMNGYEEELVKGCYEIAARYGKRLGNIEMRESSGVKALQVHDYVASTLGACMENKDDDGSECHERFAIVEPAVKRFIKK
ncbi:MAG: hypothetical protein FWH47_06620 [Methanomassiliicoccaceae archaeon]|nr:hypothetical protein [Methanomassiliicoccaceae archaeon]